MVRRGVTWEWLGSGLGVGGGGREGGRLTRRVTNAPTQLFVRRRSTTTYSGRSFRRSGHAAQGCNTARHGVAYDGRATFVYQKSFNTLSASLEQTWVDGAPQQHWLACPGFGGAHDEGCIRVSGIMTSTGTITLETILLPSLLAQLLPNCAVPFRPAASFGWAVTR